MKNNYVRLQGNIGMDPKITTLESGKTVVRFSLATNERYTNRAGQQIDETIWHNIVAWENEGMPEFKKITKGMALLVIGSLKNVSYTTKTGVEKQTYEIRASQVSFVVKEGGIQHIQEEQDLPDFQPLPTLQEEKPAKAAKKKATIKV